RAAVQTAEVGEGNELADHRVGIRGGGDEVDRGREGVIGDHAGGGGRAEIGDRDGVSQTVAGPHRVRVIGEAEGQIGDRADDGNHGGGDVIIRIQVGGAGGHA